MISVKGLYKTFFNDSGSVQVLKGIDCDIAKGEKVVIIGPSGSGKSTFLRCLNGLEETSEGHIFLDGEAVNPLSKNITAIRQKIGMVFQSYDLFPHKTILENVIMAPVLVQKRKKDEV